MKYVVQQNQFMQIDGVIENTHSAYDNTYSNNTINLSEDFLKFEHSDGLNYINIELRHSDIISSSNNINITLKEGLGIGVLYPRTNTTLIGKERYDQFHLSGYGVSGTIGLNVSLFKMFFI